MLSQKNESFKLVCVKMPPAPIECTKEGCLWTTPQNCPDWDKMVKLLELHTIAEHSSGTISTAANAFNAPKLEKLPRPAFSWI